MRPQSCCSPVSHTISDPAGNAAAWRLILGDGRSGAPSDLSATDLTATGAWNMAVDHALLASAQRGGPPTLRLYQWRPACLSFGRNQTARGVYDPSRIAGAGADVVRRPTGGLAVLHDQELTYAVALPAAMHDGPRETYAWINRVLVEGLRLLGVAAAVAGHEQQAQAPRPDAVHPCFHAPAPGEVMAGSGKVVGSAQRCERRTILQHGSILIDGDQGRIDAFRADTVTPVPAGGRLRDALGWTPDATDLIAPIISAFERAAGTRLAISPLTPVEMEQAGQFEAIYGSDEWTWRR